MIPAFIMIGSRIMPATCPGCSVSARSTAPRSLNGTTVTRSMIAAGMPLLSGTLCGRSAGPMSSSASGSTETTTESWWPW